MPSVNPYRVTPEPPREPDPEPMPSEEMFLVALLVVIGGIRVAFALVAGKPMDAEPTLGFMMLLAGAFTALRLGRWRRRRRRACNLHDRWRHDRAERD